MTLNTYIDHVKAHQIAKGAGGLQPDGTLADGQTALLPTDDLDTITAEAYNQQVFRPTTPWMTARRAVARLLAKEPRP